MKRLFCALLLISLIALPLAAHADINKMDGWLRILHHNPAQGKLLLSKAVKVDAGFTTVDCLVKSTDVLATEKAIGEAGGVVRTVLKTILTADIPVSALASISDRPEVIALEASKFLAPKMNMARSYTNVDDVQAGTGLDQAYKGTDVLFGAVDDGLNWSHADFSGRINWLEQTVGGSLRTCDALDVRDDFCNVTDGGGTFHGTHVTGIAVGADGTYTGVAPEACIGFVYNAATDADSGGTFSTAVIDGVDDLFWAADDLDVPAVVNLSLGTSLGAHDDTSLMEEGLKQLTDGQQGRIITNAAGNENVNPNVFGAAATVVGGIHADISAAFGSDKGWRFGVWNGSEALSYPTNAVVVDVWLDAGMAGNCVIDVKAFDINDFGGYITPPEPPDPPADTGQAKVSTGDVPFPTVSPVSDSDGKVKIEVDTISAEATNGKPHAIVQVTLDTGGVASDLQDYGFDVIIRATSGTCTGDMWLYPDQIAIHDFLKSIDTLAVNTGAKGIGYGYADGDSFKTMTIPGTASGVIAVGSYSGRNTWVDINGDTQHQDIYNSPGGGTGTQAGEVSLFSSLGPTADGRHKPELVAPGEPIISTLASGIAVADARKGDSTHWKLEGTSMSTPHVSGVIALMLEKNNCLTLPDVRSALQSTANVSTLTSYTADPQDTYGSGIVDALGAMQAISANTSCYSGRCASSGGGGGGGCFGTLVPVSPTALVPALAFIVSPLLVMAWRRKRR